ncbi:NRPS protein, partial [Elasticomyces elasticus]
MPIRREPTPLSRTTTVDLSTSSGEKVDFERFCRNHAVEPFHLFRLAWAIVLRIYSAESHVTFQHSIETPHGNDNRVEEPVLVALDLPEDSTIQSLLQNVTQETENGQGDDGVIFDSIKIFGSEFSTLVRQHRSQQASKCSDIDASLDDKTAAVALDVYADGDYSCAFLRYPPSILADGEAARLADSFRHAVFMIVRHPSLPLQDLDFCSQEDRVQISLWNPPLPEAIQSCVHDLISDQVKKRPDGPAISAWDGELSYQELDRLSFRVAAYLQLLGVKPETFVALCFEKSKWAVVALLGVLKAGGAYVFLDPSYPKARLSSICKDLGATLILATDKTASVGEGLATRVVQISEACAYHSTTEEQLRHSTDTQPQSALYAVFTSGSTGRPKGVTMEHGAFLSTAMANGPALHLGPDSRVLQFANYAYDVSNRDMLLTLIFGGCICVPSDSERLEDLSGFLGRHQVNWASLTPSTANLLDPDQVHSLQHLVLGGEIMTPSHFAVWAERVVLMNAYGPCECAAVSSLCTKIEQNSYHANVGRGVGSRLWIVAPADHNKLLPIGAIGELIIESTGVGRGYINADPGSNSSFLSSTTWQHEIRQEHHTRLYKTGDLGYYNADGTITFVGRADAQVKVRGQRVELAEVQHHIEQKQLDDVPVIAEVVVPRGGSHSQLAVFVALGKSVDGPPDEVAVILQRHTSGLRDRLAEHLPPYMIPSVFIPIERIPITRAGKTDRLKLRRMAALLAPEQLAELQPSRRDWRAPSTEMEKRLQALWASVLRINPEKIGADDSFLQIGGDSISVMRLVGAARDDGLQLITADVFKKPRLSELAQVVTTADTSLDNAVKPFSLLHGEVDVNDVRNQVASRCGLRSAASAEDIFPCTPLQEGLLASSERRPGDYINQNVLELRDGIDLRRLQAAWAEVIQEIPILRTRMVDLPQHGIVQVVVQTDEFQWIKGSDLGAYLKSDLQQRMGLGTPLSRIGLVKDAGKSKAYAVWTLHHAVYDGWSKPLILEELQKTYHGLKKRSFRPFQNFVQYIGTQDDKKAEQFWRSQFGGIEPGAAFPLLPSPDYRPRADRTIGSQLNGLQWPRGDVTPSTVVRASWAVLASHYLDLVDVVFGVTVSGRQGPVRGIEEICGPTIATVPLRVSVDRELALADFLMKVQSQSVEMIPFEQTGLQNIQRIAEDSRFQTLLVIQPLETADETRDRLELFRGPARDSDEGSELNAFNNYAMMLHCQLTAEGFKTQVSFDSNVIEEAQVRRIVLQLEHILRQICKEDSEQLAVRLLDPVSPEDFKDIWGQNGEVPRAITTPVHQTMMARAREQPDDLAISAWDGDLTYHELDKLSTALAHQLNLRGVTRNTITPIYFEKSMWMPVAMLAVMKAGAASVTIDITQPLERVRTILNLVQPSLILTSDTCREACSSLTDLPVVAIGPQLWEAMKTDAFEGRSLPTVLPEETLYIAFTSGSTGTPKGAPLTHGNVASSIHHQQPLLGFDTAARVLDFASYSFDVAWLNFFHTLTSGACLCVPSESARKDDIGAFMNSKRVNLACLTPSTARLLDPQAVPALKTLILAGEAMQPNDVLTWAPQVDLKNWYGPAECVSSTVQEAVTDLSQTSNIGRAYGLNSWIVSASGDHLVPFGATGELWLEGPLVGKGYLGEPEKTAISFVEDPSWFLYGGIGRLHRQSGWKRSRFYRTGDSVRYNSDGSLHFLGRKDAQVKIRGQRVELAEVEHAIWSSFTAGSSAHVVAEVVTPQHNNNSILVAFLGIGDEAIDSTDNIRAALEARIGGIENRLAGKLPTYMIPTAYLALPSIPMTVTGKTNRRQLREIAESLTLEQLIEMQPASKFRRPPQTDMEIRVQQLWASILGIAADSIGRDDTFFRIGGDSIGAMRLVAAAREQGLSLTVASIFLHSRLSELAKQVEIKDSFDHNIQPFSLLPSGSRTNDVCKRIAAQCGISASDIEDAFPCTPLQEGLLALTASRPGQYVGRVVLELSPTVDQTRLQRAWERVLEKDAKIMRTRIVDMPGVGLLQAIVSQKFEWPPIRPVDVCLCQHEQLNMGLGTPLAHFCMAKEGDKRFFVLTVHHAIYDGWTTPLIFENVTKAYHGSEIGVSAPFQAFIKHVHNNSMDCDGYWQAQLENSEAPIFPSLPSPRYQPHSDQTLERRVSDIQWPQTDITASAILRTAWSVTIAAYTDANEVVFGALLSGRQAPVPGIEGIVGPTIATVPVRVDVVTDANVHELLGRVQSQAVAMLPFEQTGLQHIRRISASAEQSCRFQTLLVVQAPPTITSPDDEHCVFLTEHHNDASLRLNIFNPYGLMVICHLESNGVKLEFSFDSNVINLEQVKLMARQLESVLRRICQAGPRATVASVMSAGIDDTDDIWKWNMTAPEKVHRCIHDFITERVRENPEAAAVCAWDGDLTYRQLDEMSTRLAYRLVDYGVGPDVVVPLCFEKTKLMPVAMLGVMKAGGASVAMDMDQPEDRLYSILQQVQSRVLLSSPLNGDIAARLGANTILFVDDTYLAGAPPTPARDLPGVNPSNMAYVVFTSGTTGTPKGAIITHENFSSAIVHQQEKLKFHPAARIFDFASYAFDAVWANFLHSASSGACLCIPSNFDRKNDIQRVMARMAVTYADLTPSTARLLDPGALPSLTTLILAGEAMAQKDISRWSDGRTLKNSYGPAECSVMATISDPLGQSSQAANIGRGFGAVTWVTDSSGTQLVPIGAVGELWLEGPIVGAGYLRNPQKTAISFVDNPDWLLQGAPGRPGRRGRLYRTGDLAKYNPDGTLIFVGRKDSQVKIRGQRVELGDIEHHVRQNFPEASDIVAEVVLPAGEDQVPVLVAFTHYEDADQDFDLPAAADGDPLMEPSERFSSLAAAAEARLQDAVPTYMIPAFFLPIRRVPAATTGKANRRLLHEMAASMDRTQLRSYTHLAANRLAPSTEMERALQTLWAQTLNLKPAAIGANDNFFKLGGDSITAMQLTAKCRSTGIQVSVAQIFSEKSIQRLALVATKMEDTLVGAGERLDVPFPLSPIQKWFFDTQPRGVHRFTQSFLLRLSRKVSCAEVVHAVESVVSRHSMLRARFPVTADGTHMQLLRSSGTGSYVFEEVQVESLDAVTERMNNTRESLDIRHGPLFAVKLINAHNDGQYLFIVAHHLVIDLVSWRILFEDLEELLTTGTASSLRSLPFQAWCELQAKYSEQHLTPEAALPFELEPPPLDYWGPEVWRNTYRDIETHSFVLDKTISKRLLGQANNAFGTQAVELFQATIWHSFQATFLDRPTPTIFCEGHGREPWDDTLDVSRTVGWFTTMWPTILPAGTPLSISETVRRTKDCRRQVPRNGWAYFNSRYLNPEGKKAFESLGPVEVLFNYEGAYQHLERQDALFHSVQDASEGPAEALRDLQRSALVEINVSIVQGCIRYSFWYNKYMEHQHNISKWMNSCKQSLEKAATELPMRKTRYTLSDFPLLRTNYEGLDELLEVTLPRNHLSLENVEDMYSCLPMQSFMLECHAGDNRMYATAYVGRLRVCPSKEPFNLARLKDAWQRVVDRHAALRTVFVPGKSGRAWTQIVKRQVAATIFELDGAQGDLLNTLKSQSPLTVDGANVPLQLTICLTAPGEVLFRLDTSHAIMDAISKTVLFEQWFATYHDQAPTKAGVLFSQHVSHVLNTTSSTTRYWLDYLTNASPCLLPVSSTTSGNDRGRPDTVPLPWGKSSTLRACAQKYGVTVSTLIKSAWLLTLHSFTGARYVCFGYLESGRNVPIAGTQHTVGALLSTLVCQIEVDDDALVRDILDAVQEDYRSSMLYQAGGALGAIDNLGLNPPSTRLFNSLINYRKAQQVSESLESSTDILEEYLYGEDGME